MSTPHHPGQSWFAVWRLPFFSDRRSRTALLIVIVLFAALIAYQSAYMAIVDEVLGATMNSGMFELRPWPDYSCGNRIPFRWAKTLENFFRPSHLLDKQMRPAKWAALSHRLTPDEIKNGVVEIQLKPEWKRHLPPNHESLTITMTL